MINCVESIETLILKEPERKENHLTEKIHRLSPGNISMKKAKRKTSFKDKIPLCNWTMPIQPEGYIRAGKYDLL